MRRLLLLALVLVPGAPASAGLPTDCSYNGTGDWQTAANWSCGHVPMPPDSVGIGAGDNVTISSVDAVAGGFVLSGTGTLAIASGRKLTATGMVRPQAGTLSGPGTLVVDDPGSFAKQSAGDLVMNNDFILELNRPGVVEGGRICITDPNTTSGTGIWAKSSFTIAATAPFDVFDCGSTANFPLFLIDGAAASLVIERAGETRFGPAVRVVNATATIPAGATVLTRSVFAVLAAAQLTVEGTLECRPAPPPNPLRGTLSSSGLVTGSGTVDCIHIAGGGVTRAGPGGLDILRQISLASGHLLDVPAGRTLTAQGVLSDGDAITVVADGTLAAPVSLGDGAILRGSGQVTGKVTNTAGIVRPGTSPGTLSVPSYEQGPNGVLEAEIGGTQAGTQHDVLAVAGEAKLDGTLALRHVAGYAPKAGDQYQVVTSGSRSGTFAAVTVGAIPGGGTFGVSYPGGPLFGARVAFTPPPSPPSNPPITTTPSPATTTPVPPAPPPRPMTTPDPAAALASLSREALAQRLGLPSARRCTSRRRFPIRIRAPRGVTLANVTVTVAGRRVRTKRSSGAFTATVDLRGVRKAQYAVRIVARSATGVRLVGERRYRTCARRRS